MRVSIVSSVASMVLQWVMKPSSDCCPAVSMLSRLAVDQTGERFVLHLDAQLGRVEYGLHPIEREVDPRGAQLRQPGQFLAGRPRAVAQRAEPAVEAVAGGNQLVARGSGRARRIL